MAAVLAPAGAFGLNLLTLLREKSAERGTALNAAGIMAPDVSAIGKSSLSEKTVFFTDGFSRAGCSLLDREGSALEKRISFTEKACGEEGVSSCFLTSLPMEPTLCFDFCRTQGPEYRFFGIRGGGDCYCSTFYDKRQDTGGLGTCDLPCGGKAGEDGEMCGGADTTSLFEMHMCADSVKEAEVALALAEKSKASLDTLINDVAMPFQENLKTMSERWVLEGACSLQAHGVCEYKGKWLDVGNKLKTLMDTQSKRQSDEMKKVVGALKVLNIKNGDAEAGENADLPEIEKATAAVEAQTRVVNEQTEILTHFLEDAKVGLALTPQADPIQVEAAGEKGFKEVTLFEELGDTEKNWHAVCDMEPHGYGTVVSFNATDHKLCSKTCLEDVNCMGYNVAVVDNAMSCTFLSREGLTQPAIAFAVPIFEISQTKVDALKFDQIACYMRKTFMNDNGRGKTKTDVKKRITNV
jgi:hypothetical protein